MAVPRPEHLRSTALRDLAALVGAHDPGSEVVVTGVTLDSRAVLPGDLYAALPGSRAHGADFTAPALAAGAVDAGLSRGLVGVSGSTLVVNLASSRAAVRDGMATLTPLLRHVIAQLSGLDSAV